MGILKKFSSHVLYALKLGQRLKTYLHILMSLLLEIVADFIFLGFKITADGDYSHEIKRYLLLGKKVMTNLDSILKSRDITLPGASLVAQRIKSICLQCRRLRFNPWVGKIPWRRKWQPTPVLLPLKSYGKRSLVGYCPLGRKESNTTERLHFTLPTKVYLVKAMDFPVVMYGCESWTIKKAERRGIDTFELWCWKRLLRVPWTVRRSKPVHPKGDQFWVFIGRTDVEAETQILWPPDGES